MTTHGYARVSTRDQNLDLQLTALEAAGCDRIWPDQASGKNTARPELRACLAALEEGDTLVVYKLDRLGRSVVDLANIVTELGERGVEFRSLTEGFDTTTNGGKLVFHIFAAVAEFERELIRERAADGLAAARASGRRLGRPTVRTPEKVRAAKDLDAQGWPVVKIAATLGISRRSVLRCLGEGEPGVA